MATFVLVPGAWHGSWAFEAVTPLLAAAGHTVHALTLTGLSPDHDDETAARANLDTHATDVVRVLEAADITEATLVGHSYGGMVITAAADRAAQRVSRLVHLDAYVPRDGDSCWSLTTDAYRQSFIDGAAETGHTVRPPFRPRAAASLAAARGRNGPRAAASLAAARIRWALSCSGSG
ncbi:alpha/beta hydrolase [Microbacterium sp. KUDC0406]|uniref:alpha/beta fold hydrolase n=1 Tax=Microbacterium sp. KUDC0406 TaxID=2909588 RepID=UPI001F3C7338|nr:alpha/beta fold hydrolase [Microbacterium sp. KUDC0406]UJP09065.1 alpha/beta hydrolase [Microbacterium sp. KUDC0406]